MLVDGLNPKTAFTVEKLIRFATSTASGYMSPDRPGVEEDMGALRVEPHRENVEEVLPPPPARLLAREPAGPGLLVIGDLDVHLGTEPLLEPSTQLELHQVGRVERPGRAAARVDEEWVPAFVLIEQGVQVPMGVVDPPGDQRVQRAPG